MENLAAGKEGPRVTCVCGMYPDNVDFCNCMSPDALASPSSQVRVFRHLHRHVDRQWTGSVETFVGACVRVCARVQAWCPRLCRSTSREDSGCGTSSRDSGPWARGLCALMAAGAVVILCECGDGVFAVVAIPGGVCGCRCASASSGGVLALQRTSQPNVRAHRAHSE